MQLSTEATEHSLPGVAHLAVSHREGIGEQHRLEQHGIDDRDALRREASMGLGDLHMYADDVTGDVTGDAATTRQRSNNDDDAIDARWRHRLHRPQHIATRTHPSSSTINHHQVPSIIIKYLQSSIKDYQSSSTTNHHQVPPIIKYHQSSIKDHQSSSTVNHQVSSINQPWDQDRRRTAS